MKEAEESSMVGDTEKKALNKPHPKTPLFEKIAAANNEKFKNNYEVAHPDMSYMVALHSLYIVNNRKWSGFNALMEWLGEQTGTNTLIFKRGKSSYIKICIEEFSNFARTTRTQ